MTDQVSPEGAVAPIETQAVPTPAPEAQPKPEAVPDKAPEPQGELEGKEPKGVAKRIKELTDARRAAEAREERLLKLLEQRQPEAPRAQADDEAPKTLKDFNYDERAYLEYAEKRSEARAEKTAKAVAERYRSEQEAIQRRAKFDERIDAFAKTVDDYHDVVNESTPVSEAMADAIQDSDEAGPLMYYLGNNRDVALKLYHMSPAKAGREIQKIEDRLVAERKKAAEKPVSQAPPPAPKIESKDPGLSVRSASDPASDKLPVDQWLKLREKEVRRK